MYIYIWPNWYNGEVGRHYRLRQMQCESKTYLHSSRKIALANGRGNAFGKFLNPGTYIQQTQVNRAIVNGTPRSPSNLLITSWKTLSKTDNGYPFLDKADLMNSILSSRKHLDEIMRARWIRVLILRCWGQNESHLIYRPEKLGFLYTEVGKAVEALCTNTSKKASWWLDSFSTVNFKEGCMEFNCIRNESVSFSFLNSIKCRHHNDNIWGGSPC